MSASSSGITLAATASFSAYVERIAETELEAGAESQRQCVRRRRDRGDAAREARADERRHGRDCGSQVAVGRGADGELDGALDPDPGQRRVRVTVGRAHHPTALGDEVGVGSLAHDGDRPLGHDDDAQRVREGAVEVCARDGRQCLDRSARVRRGRP